MLMSARSASHIITPNAMRDAVALWEPETGENAR